MTNYSNDSYMCRVDFFKPSGKWYATEAIDFRLSYEELDCLGHALKKAGNPYSDMTAVCLHPYTWEYPRCIPHDRRLAEEVGVQ